MKKIITISSIVFTSSLFFAFHKIHSTGETGATGSPGEGTCSGCHNGGAAGTTVSITSAPAFSNNAYDPGTVYTINIVVAHPSQPKFGFGCEILNSSNANAGTMANAGAGVNFANAGNGRKNAKHTAPKTGTGSATFTFEWTPPLSGDVTFYVSGNAVNGTGSSGGDSPAATTLSLSNSLATSLDKLAETTEVKAVLYPNPGKGFTSMSYFLSKDQTIKLELLELNGKLVKTICDELRPAGQQDHKINLMDVPSGLYFIKMSSNERLLTQKLISVQ